METSIEIFPTGSVWRNIIVILVLIGTNPYSFDRLVKAIDEYASKTGEEIFIQLGHTQYIPQYAKYERFLEREKVKELIQKAELVVCQGGFGSLSDCLQAGKKIVAVPRMPQFNEAPDCQEELVRALEKERRLIGVYKISELPAAIERARKSTFNHNPSSPSWIGELIKSFLEKHLK